MINLMLGDCLERMKEIPDGSVDLTVTSPPYDNLRTYKNSLDWGDHVWKPALQELFRVTKKGGVVVWIVGDATIKGSETGTSFKQALYAKELGFNLHDTMIYKKENVGMYDPRNMRYKSSFEYVFIFSIGRPFAFNPIKDKPVKNPKRMLHRSNGRTVNGEIRKAKRQSIISNKYQDRHNVWEYPTGLNVVTKDKIAYQHPAIFPEKLANDHIISWSNEGDTVLDCFMGSGTTGKMALLNNRKFIGIEKDAWYFEIAKQRLVRMTTTAIACLASASITQPGHTATF